MTYKSGPHKMASKIRYEVAIMPGFQRAEFSTDVRLVKVAAKVICEEIVTVRACRIIWDALDYCDLRGQFG